MLTRIVRWLIAIPAALLAAMAAHALIMVVGRAAYTYVTMDFGREGLLGLLSEFCLRFTAAGAAGVCFVQIGTAVAPAAVRRRTSASGILLVLILLMSVAATFAATRHEWLEICFTAITVLGGTAAYQQLRGERLTAGAAAAGVVY